MFENPITGLNGVLIRKQIQSANFVTGVSGWIIRQDGSAEFNGAIFRGSVVITQSQDLLIYSTTTPQLNKLIVALAGSAGNDGLGNSWQAGLNIYDAAGINTGFWGTSGFKLTNDNAGTPAGFIAANSISGSGQSPALVFGTLVGISSTSASIASVPEGTNPNQYDQIFYSGPVTASDATNSSVSLNQHGKIPGGVGAAGILQYSDNTGSATMAGWNAAQGFVGLGSIIAMRPGTSGATATTEIWHNLSLNAGYTAFGGSTPAPRYQLEGINGGRVRLSGALTLTANHAANTTIATLPVGYRPSFQQEFLCINSLSGQVALNTTIHIDTAGNIVCEPSGISGNILALDGIVFALD